MDHFQSKLLHEEPLASQLKEAYAVPFEHDIREALTRLEEYLPLTGERRHPLSEQPERYVWTRKHHVIPVRSDTVRTHIECDNNVMWTHRKGFARILHKIQCDNMLAKAHDLASKFKPDLKGPLSMDDVLSAKDQLQAHAPGMDMHLHLDQDSFNSIKTSPWVYLTRRSNDASSYDAYRGTVETEREGFKIHLWVVPPSLLQRGFHTVNFMTTHGGILFQEYPHPFIATEDVNSWCEDGNTAIILGDVVVIHTHKTYADDPCYYMHQLFSMSIGDQNAIVRLPDSVEPDPA